MSYSRNKNILVAGLAASIVAIANPAVAENVPLTKDMLQSHMRYKDMEAMRSNLAHSGVNLEFKELEIMRNMDMQKATEFLQSKGVNDAQNAAQFIRNHYAAFDDEVKYTERKDKVTHDEPVTAGTDPSEACLSSTDPSGRGAPSVKNSSLLVGTSFGAGMSISSKNLPLSFVYNIGLSKSKLHFAGAEYLASPNIGIGGYALFGSASKKFPYDIKMKESMAGGFAECFYVSNIGQLSSHVGFVIGAASHKLASSNLSTKKAIESVKYNSIVYGVNLGVVAPINQMSEVAFSYRLLNFGFKDKTISGINFKKGGLTSNFSISANLKF